MCSRFLLSIWPDRTKGIGLLLASWTPLVLWLLFLDWVETLEIRPCEMTELRSFDPLDLNLLRFLLLAYHIFFFLIQLLYLWKQGWWPFNGVTSGTRDSVPHGRGGLGVVWCLSKMFLFFPRQIAQDLVRFLRCIAADELDSPPRSPTFVKPHLPPPLGSAASMDSDDIPYVVNPHPRSSSVSKPPSRGPLTRGNSLEKGYLTRTTSIERSSRKSATSSSPTSTTPPK